MKTGLIIRFACLTALWILLCYLVISTRGLNFWTLFAIVVSGVLVFVPNYKKHIRGNNGNERKQHK
jgi:hypothetical protein